MPSRPRLVWGLLGAALLLSAPVVVTWLLPTWQRSHPYRDAVVTALAVGAATALVGSALEWRPARPKLRVVALSLLVVLVATTAGLVRLGLGPAVVGPAPVDATPGPVAS